MPQGAFKGQAILKFLLHGPNWAILKTCVSLSQRCPFSKFVFSLYFAYTD